MGPLASFFAGLPQESFAEVRRRRDEPGADQQRLALEDRRAFAREFTRDNPVLGPIAIGILAPVEQAVKAVVPDRVLQSGDAPISRSGSSNPVESVGAAWSGVLQGLNDRGLFGSR